MPNRDLGSLPLTHVRYVMLNAVRVLFETRFCTFIKESDSWPYIIASSQHYISNRMTVLFNLFNNITWTGGKGRPICPEDNVR